MVKAKKISGILTHTHTRMAYTHTHTHKLIPTNSPDINSVRHSLTVLLPEMCGTQAESLIVSEQKCSGLAPPQQVERGAEALLTPCCPEEHPPGPGPAH